MKKVLKSRIFAFVLGAVIFGGLVGVSAYTIFANDIGYTPKDTTWKKSNGEDITNVKDAIDELYTKANSSFQKSTKYLDLTTINTLTFNFNPTIVLVDCIGIPRVSWDGVMTYINEKYSYYLTTDAIADGASHGSISINNNTVNIEVAGSMGRSGTATCTVLVSE